MGTHGNGDNLPADGDRWPDESRKLPDLPALPPGVTVPDDPSALAGEAEQIRAELAGTRPTAGSSLASDRSAREPALTPPLLIMSVAVVITLVSLFAMTWSGSDGGDQPPDDRPSLPEVVLADTAGQLTDVSSSAPVAVLLVESCACGELISDTVAAAPPGVTVLAVGADTPARPPGVTTGADLRLLADPEGVLRDTLGLGAPRPDTATVILADQHRTITHTVPAATSTVPYAEQLAVLGTDGPD